MLTRHASPALLFALVAALGFSACTDDVVPSTTDTDIVETDAGNEEDTGVQNVCGDGVRGALELCDDGNRFGEDGCAADCMSIEEGWSCPSSGACIRANVCGDGLRSDTEVCDDANTLDGDGCPADCSAVEAGWSCPEAGLDCVAAECGDGVLAGDEACDDGDPNDGNGCSAACDVETGWVCLGTGVCIAQRCGDGIVAGDEVCDDGNADAGDGCAADCALVEPNFICPTANQACVTTVVCGDRRIGPGEGCDDGNTDGGDGCDVDCHLEPGWACLVPGARCLAAQCGDGLRVDHEACDDTNMQDGDGCSALCQVELGWACPPNQSCFETVCGDGLREGTEQCDDGNLRPFDGCSAACTNEPQCDGGTCTAICGDGVILPGPTQEACDDGNTNAGDGCSASCTIEAGWACVVAPEPLPAEIVLPLVVRDFKGIQWYADNATQHGHPDFNDPNDANGTILFGIVKPNLGADGRPDLAYAAAPTSDTTGLPKFTARFDQWYDSSSAWNIEEVRPLTLTRGANDTFDYDSSVDGFPPYSTKGFYPIDDGGWVAQGSEAKRPSHDGINDGLDHNFNFTTETHFFFQYEGDEVLSFSGDDDMWVFIDGVLCLDVGGLHGARAATMNLADPTLEANLTQRAIVQSCKAHLEGLVTGNNPKPLVEMAIFHAERHTEGSNFKLALTGFVKQRSSCDETCGDGIVTPGEVCDDGVNDGSYNGCGLVCRGFGGYCGDASVNGPESCDDGVAFNDGRYDGCNPDCTPAGSCGDGVVQPRNEVCDDGVNDGSYNGCSANCQTRSPRCGDGVINGPEACDDGVGVNLGEYGGCNPDCSRAAYCGDGVRQATEECDDGDTDDLDGCSNACVRVIL